MGRENKETLLLHEPVKGPIANHRFKTTGPNILLLLKTGQQGMIVNVNVFLSKILATDLMMKLNKIT